YEHEVTSAILDFLYYDWQEWDELHLAAVMTDSPVAAALRCYWQDRQASFSEVPGPTCWQAELPRSWDKFLETRSKKRRHELRRYGKRLQAQAGTFLEP